MAANRYSDLLAASYEASHAASAVGDESFYREHALAADGPVLEAACGTGRLYLDLLRAGVDADGFDISRPMLNRLRRKSDDVTPRVWQADLRAPATDREYARAFVPYNSIANLTTVDDQLAALDALHDVLEPGGRLVFDAFVPRFDVIAESFGEWHSEQSFEHEGGQFVARTRATIEDTVAGTFRTEHEIQRDGEVVAEESFVLAHLPPQQIELLARESQFDEWTVAGGFDGEPLTDGDAVQVWTLRA
ncbi:class I SAM-dependent methyltransferase [Salarchaeum japonicum]|uniref:class I SAM-dependent methyltransferase n=1 Tax=Salarchaeum japonicum TaxID=555573 RepID=UPI003C78F503